MIHPPNSEARRALAMLPSGVFVVTSSFEGKKGGVLVKSVMPCADEPLLVCVAAWKGHGIEPLIRDSRHFCVNQIDPDDKLVLRMFQGHISEHASSFDSLPTERIVSQSPAIKRALVAIDCEVVRHLDMEADHELYIGLVLGARVYRQAGAGAMTNDAK